jgi:hypothetical protein
MTAILLGLLLIVIIGATACRLACLFRSPASFIIAAFFFAWAEIVLVGFALSALHLLNSIWAWIISAVIGIALTGLSSVFLPSVIAPNIQRIARIALEEWRAISFWQRLVLGVLAAATVIVSAVNFAMAVAVAPYCWDTLTYHLPRVAYFLQFGSLDYFPANYVYQNAHAKDGSLLLIFAFLSFGRHENSMPLVQFVAWWVTAISVYGLARNAGNRRFESIVCGLLFMLLTECVMEALTCQNDLLVAACGAGAAYFVLHFRNSKQIWVAGLPVGLGFGTKISFLPLFASLCLVALFAVPGPYVQWIRRMILLLIGVITSMALLSLPAGYAANFRRFGNPVGPTEMIAADSNANRSIPQLVKIGGLNLVRMGFDFYSLDGLPHIEPFLTVQRWMRAGPISLADRILGAQLKRPENPDLPAFKLERRPEMDENSSYWGPLGFLFIWPSVLLVVCCCIGTRIEAVMAGAAITFTCALAFIHPYDPWMGRFLLGAAPLACAATGSTIRASCRSRYWRYWIALVVAIGSFAAVSAVLFCGARPVFPNKERASIFTLDRLSQMTIRNKGYREAIQAFDALTPRDATVAVLLPGDSYEFPLFGKGLTRRLLPAITEWSERRTFPEAAQYVLFSNQILPPEQTDIPLGRDWYLRCLDNNNTNKAAALKPSDSKTAAR